MEGDQNFNLKWCIISSVAVYLFSHGYLLAFFFVKLGAKITLVIFFVFFNPPLLPDIEKKSAMIDLEKEVVIYFWYGKLRLNAFSGI